MIPRLFHRDPRTSRDPLPTFPQVVEKCVEKVSFPHLALQTFVQDPKIPHFSRSVAHFRGPRGSRSCGQAFHSPVGYPILPYLSTAMVDRPLEFSTDIRGRILHNDKKRVGSCRKTRENAFFPGSDRDLQAHSTGYGGVLHMEILLTNIKFSIFDKEKQVFRIFRRPYGYCY